MKKLAKILTAAALCVAALTTFGCGDDKKEAAKAPAGDAPIKIAVTAGPHAEIMDNVKKLAEKQGLKIEVVEFNDYVTPNVALFQGEVFANSMQHRPYLDATLQKEPKFDLVEVFKTVNFPMAAYSKTLKKGDAIPDGATIGIPNDPSNGGRALLLLEKNGLLKLKEGVNPVKAVVSDIASNPKNLKIIELEAPQLPRALEDCDASIINGGYAVSAGLDPKTALAQEDNTSPYVNVIAAREQDKDNPTYQKFVKIFQTEATRKYINDNFQVTLIPGF